MRINDQVAVEDLIDCLFTCNFNNVVMLGECVHDSDWTSLLRQFSNHVAFILPPWHHKLLCAPVGVGALRRHMQVAAGRRQELSAASLSVHVGFRLKYVGYLNKSCLLIGLLYRTSE